MTYGKLKIVLDIFAKYEHEGDEASTGGSDHDILFVSSRSEDEIHPWDAERLQKLNCFYSDRYGCWCVNT